MDPMKVSNEIQRLLQNPPMGGLSALARSAGITAASVSAWRQGKSVPTPSKWPQIEQFLGVPEGHLERVSLGQGDSSVVASWPKATVVGRAVRWSGGRSRQSSDAPVSRAEFNRLQRQVRQLSERLGLVLDELDADEPPTAETTHAVPAVDR